MNESTGLYKNPRKFDEWAEKLDQQEQRQKIKNKRHRRMIQNRKHDQRKLKEFD